MSRRAPIGDHEATMIAMLALLSAQYMREAGMSLTRFSEILREADRMQRDRLAPKEPSIGPSGAGDEFAWVPSWLSNPPTPTPAAERGAATLRKLPTPKEP